MLGVIFMPSVPKTPRKTTLAASSGNAASSREIQSAVSYHGNALLILFVFTLLTSFALALWMFKLYVGQRELAMGFEAMVSRLQSGEDRSLNGSMIRPQDEKDEQTFVRGLYVHALPCPAGFIGNCDDMLLYRRSETGMRSVVLPSVRALFPGGLPLPALERNSHNARYLVMTAKRSGGADPEVSYIYLVDSVTGETKAVTVDLSDGTTYSADNLFAAYIKDNGKGDYREVVVVDLMHDVSKVVAKAKMGESFWNGSGWPTVLSVNAKQVIFDVYTSPTSVGHPVTKEERTVTFSF